MDKQIRPGIRRSFEEITEMRKVASADFVEEPDNCYLEGYLAAIDDVRDRLLDLLAAAETH